MKGSNGNPDYSLIPSTMPTQNGNVSGPKSHNHPRLSAKRMRFTHSIGEGGYSRYACDQDNGTRTPVLCGDLCSWKAASRDPFGTSNGTTPCRVAPGGISSRRDGS